MRKAKIVGFSLFLLLFAWLVSAEEAEDSREQPETKVEMIQEAGPAVVEDSETRQDEPEAKSFGSLGFCRYSCIAVGSGSFQITRYSFYSSYSECCEGTNLCPVGENPVARSWNGQRCQV